MSERTLYEVEWAPGLTGQRRIIAGYTGVIRTTVCGPSGRPRQFPTLSGAQRVCDHLNAEEHKRISG